MTDIREILIGVELFDGLTDQELEEVAGIFKDRPFHRGEILAKQGSPGDELFLVIDGFVEVLVTDGDDRPARVVVNLGTGQIIGEMSLVDQGVRSATVRAISEPTRVRVARRKDFLALCERNTRIGFVVMRNIAADLSFKLRHRNLAV